MCWEEKEIDQANTTGSSIIPSFNRKKALDGDDLDAKEHQKYRSIVSIIMYLVVKTRPVLGVAASILGADVQYPTVNHMAEIK